MKQTAKKMRPDIPDHLEIKGKKIPVDKEDYKRWALAAGTRIAHFSQADQIEITFDNQIVGRLDLREFIQINPNNDGTTIKLGKLGPKIKDGLVGLGGNYLNPYFLGAKDPQQVVDSWNWLFERMSVNKEDFEINLEFVYILDFIRTGKARETIFRIMSLAVDLQELDKIGVNTAQKISELSEKINGHLRSFKKYKNDQKGRALFQISLLTHALSDLFAESRLARFARASGYNVAMNRSPDLLIDNVRVEAKFDRSDELDEGSFLNKVQKGLKQKGELVAIFTNPQKIDITKLKLTWFPLESLANSLKMGINTCKNGRKCILLYTTTNKGYFGRLAIIR